MLGNELCTGATTTVPWLSNANAQLFLCRASFELSSALQPIVDINTGRTIAVEALVRGCQKLGFATPENMLDFAYEAERLLALEQILQRKAVEQYAECRKAGFTILFLNLDGRLLRHAAEIAVSLTDRLRAFHFETTDVCFEISERYQPLDAAEFAAQIDVLRTAGFLVAIDDFGIGNSGLQMLYQCSPDFIKIDRFFVSAVQGDAKKRLLLTSIVKLAHVLGVRVIAEGVETTSELMSCRSIRCDLAQGYYVARPTTEIATVEFSYKLNSEELASSPCLLSATDVRNLVDPIKPVETGTELTEIFGLFENNPLLNMVPIVDAAGMPRGVIREQDLRPFVYSRFGRDLLANKSLGHGLAEFQRAVAVADINSQLNSLLDLAASSSTDCVVITEDMRYLGVLNPTALLRLSTEMRNMEARDQNPLSRLPGNGAVRDHLAKALANQDLLRIICYLDVDNFKPFNDKYGFSVGDRVLTILAGILKAKQLECDMFVGHIGGDDFVIGATGDTCARVVAGLQKLRTCFAREVESLYTEADRLAGKIMAVDRSGQRREYPLLSCSIAALELAPGETCANAEQLSAELAHLKALAKASHCGLVHSRLTPGPNLPHGFSEVA